MVQKSSEELLLVDLTRDRYTQNQSCHHILLITFIATYQPYFTSMEPICSENDNVDVQLYFSIKH